MIAYSIRRILFAIPLILGITVISFFIIQLAPGGPTSLLLDPSLAPEDLEKMKEKLGLDQPVYIQYFSWLTNMLHGDFGTSFIHRGIPVGELILDRIPNTLILMITSTIIAAIFAIPLGVISASKPYSTLDYSVTFFSFLGVATPNFWLGLMLIMLFSVQLEWFPTGGVASLHTPFSVWDRLHHLLLPAFVLASADMATLTRYTRSSMIEVLKQDYIRTARAKGFRRWRVIVTHGLRNGLIPVVTLFGLLLPSFIAGSVIVEQVFSWPGIGKLFIDATFQRDYPVIMAITVISSILVVLGNVIADILYAIIDPRIEYS